MIIENHMPRVLVVEDEFLVRAALCEFLEDIGFRVLQAVNGDQALAVLKRVGSKIEAMVTDIRMPGAMDGFGLTDWVHRYFPQTPVILTSGDVGSGRRLKLLPQDVFLPKPYSLSRLADELTKRCC